MSLIRSINFKLIHKADMIIKRQSLQQIVNIMYKQILHKTYSSKLLQLNTQINLYIKHPILLSNIHTFKPRNLTIGSKYHFATSSNKQQQKQQNASDGNHKFDANSSYFEILGVQPNATQQQIKSAYLEMVKKYHPDLSKQENASQKFQLIQKAYEVLSDPQQRGKHRSQQKIPNPQTYQDSNDLKQKYKDFKRKDSVPDEWHFTYKLFKKHYEQVDAKEKDYKKFVGQGDQYWIHKDQMQPNKKVFAQQIGMIGGAIGITAGAFYYMNN